MSTRADVLEQLVSNVTGSVNQSAANERTPHLLRTPQANGNVPAGQASLHSCSIPKTAFFLWPRNVTLHRDCTLNRSTPRLPCAQLVSPVLLWKCYTSEQLPHNVTLHRDCTLKRSTPRLPCAQLVQPVLLWKCSISEQLRSFAGTESGDHSR